jgi:N-formylglutamate amidohydrolase
MHSDERLWIDRELNPSHDVVHPVRHTVPLVFCSPHSGRVYPKGFVTASRLSPQDLRKSEDCYVDELFAGVTGLGAPLLAARFPRAYLDVNREPFELDPELFAGPLPAFANTQSLRVAGGLGTIPRVVTDAEEIYAHRLPLSAGLERIERLYKPFHVALREMVETTRARFGMAILIDCHSMPSVSAGQPQNLRPHFVVGDRFGTACDPRLTRSVREILQGLGYDVQLNRPYAGGFITEHYGQPSSGIHAVQIEVNRALYLNEATLQRSSGFEPVQRDLLRLVERLIAILPVSAAYRTAAE